MLNFVPKRIPSVNLLYGTRPFQRIEVGHRKHHVELPLSVVDQLYNHVDSSVHYHNGDYNPLKWKYYMSLKLKAYYLYNAAKSTENTKTALTQLDFYPKLASLYLAELRHAQLTVNKDICKENLFEFCLPIQGKNI